MRVIRVPKGRFNTAITLLDGTSAGETSGGFTVPASTSYPINFMIVHPSAVLQVVKHVAPRIFSPQVNQLADAWKFDYRDLPRLLRGEEQGERHLSEPGRHGQFLMEV